jgi:putative redox protein
MSEFDSATLPSEPELDRRVTIRTGQERYRSDVVVRGHRFVVDEPPEIGGGDTGPTPFDLLCAGLGACVTITLRMYADRKQWPLEEVVARVAHRRKRADFENEREGDVFNVQLDLRGALDDTMRQRLLEIAGRCPAHRMLVAGAAVEVRLAEHLLR